MDKTEQIKSKTSKSGNKYFKLGRPSKYNPRYCKQIIDFFTQELYTERIKSTLTQKNGSVIDNYELVPNPPLFIGEFAYTLGVDDKTLENWSKSQPAFLLAYTRARQLQQEHIIKLANIGLFNSNFAQFTMVNISEWRIKNNIEHSGKVDAQVFFDKMLEKGAEAVQNEASVMSKSRLN